MAPDALAQVLRPIEKMFPAEQFPQLTLGLGRGDDAAVYKLSDELAIIATLDFFTPIVDDPYYYGAISAANSLSDIYAMGGHVAFALNICCFPDCLPPETLIEILRGGAEKVAEAGGALAGGHTIEDNEPKYGLAAIGFVHPDRVLAKSGAQPGDALILTKPLGVGIVTTALKADQAEPEHIDASVQSMLRLNRVAAELLQAGGAHACTDVTGFALIGHSLEIAENSGVSLHIHADRLPFVPGAKEYAEDWLFPAGTGHNQQAYRERVRVSPGIAEEMEHLLYTPETSGGLLAAIPRDRLTDLQSAFENAGEPLHVVGEVLPGQGLEVFP